MVKRMFAVLAALALSSLVVAQPQPPATPWRCGTGPRIAPPKLELPAVVTGRFGFYAAAYNGDALLRETALGDVDALFPTASLFKTLVVHAAMRAVDAGSFKLETRLTTTAANQSIERFPSGTNPVRRLALRAIQNSDNTASDILHLAVSPRALALRTRQRSPCTTVLLTTKAWWSAQAGLAKTVLGDDLIGGARRYAGLPFPQRLEVAAQLVENARKVAPQAIEAGLEAYFRGPLYTPDLELWLQNTTTPRAYTGLLLEVMRAQDLQPNTRGVFRQLMSTGCCISKDSPVRSTYRAAKAGSGWRMLTLSGYVETPDGRTLVYTYMNDQSATLDAEDMERQISLVNAWIDAALLSLKRQ